MSREIVGFLLVALLWGCTTPLIKKAQAQVDLDKQRAAEEENDKNPGANEVELKISQSSYKYETELKQARDCTPESSERRISSSTSGTGIMEVLRWRLRYGFFFSVLFVKNLILSGFGDLIDSLKRWQILVPYLINQCGSVLFSALVGKSAISRAIPVVNSLAILFTSITEFLLLDTMPSAVQLVGCVAILGGAYLCMQ